MLRARQLRGRSLEIRRGVVGSVGNQHHTGDGRIPKLGHNLVQGTLQTGHVSMTGQIFKALNALRRAGKAEEAQLEFLLEFVEKRIPGRLQQVLLDFEARLTFFAVAYFHTLAHVVSHRYEALLRDDGVEDQYRLEEDYQQNQKRKRAQGNQGKAPLTRQGPCRAPIDQIGAEHSKTRKYPGDVRRARADESPVSLFRTGQDDI